MKLKKRGTEGKDMAVFGSGSEKSGFLLNKDRILERQKSANKKELKLMAQVITKIQKERSDQN